LTAPRALFWLPITPTCSPRRWSQANSAVFQALLSPAIPVLAEPGATRSPDPWRFGPTFSGKHYNAVQYGINTEYRFLIDYDEVEVPGGRGNKA